LGVGSICLTPRSRDYTTTMQTGLFV